MSKGAKPAFKARNLTDDDRQSWVDAIDAREKSPLKPVTQEQIRAAIRKRNPVRWFNLNRDYKWVQREMKRMGLNPEDARYLL